VVISAEKANFSLYVRIFGKGTTGRIGGLGGPDRAVLWRPLY